MLLEDPNALEMSSKVADLIMRVWPLNGSAEKRGWGAAILTILIFAPKFSHAIVAPKEKKSGAPQLNPACFTRH